jgi:hypothetical protein
LVVYICIFLYVFECLKPKRQKELNVLIAYNQVSQKYKIISCVKYKIHGMFFF